MNGTGWWLTLDRMGFQTVRLLLSVVWQSSILLAAAGLLAWALRRRRASVRLAILAAAILSSPLIPLLGRAASWSRAQVPIPVMPSYSTTTATVEPAEAAPPVASPAETVTAAPVVPYPIPVGALEFHFRADLSMRDEPTVVEFKQLDSNGDSIDNKIWHCTVSEWTDMEAVQDVVYHVKNSEVVDWDKNQPYPNGCTYTFVVYIKDPKDCNGNPLNPIADLFQVRLDP